MDVKEQILCRVKRLNLKDKVLWTGKLINERENDTKEFMFQIT